MIYFDYAATSPLRREALESMWPYLTTNFGNPSSTHEVGRQAKVALDDARARIAAVINCSPGEIIFTSGGTESDNLAINGLHKGRIVTTVIEHKAVLEACYASGAEIVFAPVNSDGLVDVDVLAGMLQPGTLCSIAYANNEIGTVQFIVAIAALCRAAGAVLHCDAVQAAGSLPLDVEHLGVDAMSVSAHKFGGPKGVGFLYLRSGVMPKPVLHGGGQERGLRSGTENVAAIVGMATALEVAARDDSLRIAAMRDHLLKCVLSEVHGAMLTGSRRHRLPNHASFCVEGTFGESVLIELENDGIICSSGSACAAGSDEVSHVLTGIGVPPDLARSALRFTLSAATTEDEIQAAIVAIPSAIERVRKLANP